ncbi:MAG: phenylalanine--tRNA ligase subunit beta [Thermoplasmata archaeon]
MVVIKISKRDLETYSGINIENILKFFDTIGIEIKREDENSWDLELYPDRPDLYSIFGISRALKIFYLKKNIVYNVKNSGINLIVDESVSNVRPYIGAALINNVELDDSRISYIIDMQEKLHLSIGRDRKKLAIGLHDFDKVKAPFVYKAVSGNEISFIPLGMDVKLTPEEILKIHPKGIEYSHLLSGFSKYPVILDVDGNVLSFPPIINGTLTEINKNTRNIFIDVTGTDLFSVLNALNIVTTNILELGGNPYKINVNYGKYSLELPNLGEEKYYISKKTVSEMLGENINLKMIKETLISMGYSVKKVGRGFRVGVPPYRIDIMHQVDIVEDVIKAYGYENIPLSLPEKFSIGKESEVEKIKEKIRKIMVGLGYIEVMNLTFTSIERNFKTFGMEVIDSPKIENPVVEDQIIFRTWIFPMLMETLANNRHRSLPQKIFEVGKVFRNFETVNLGAVSEESDASFTNVKGTVERIALSLNIKISQQESNFPFLIDGRQSWIIINGKFSGFFGEVHPLIIEKFNLGNPVTMFEIYLDTFYPKIVEEKLKF